MDNIKIKEINEDSNKNNHDQVPNISKGFFPKTHNSVANLTKAIFKKHFPEKHPCTFCCRKNTNLQRCTICKVAFYCNRECQKKDWKRVIKQINNFNK